MRIIQISDSHIAHDIPQRQADLDACINAVNAESPDLVIHTGDITHNGRRDEYAIAHQSLDKLQAPYYLLNGNKDYRDPIRDTFATHTYLNQSNGFLQYSIEHYPARLLIVDTVRESTSKGELCAQRLEHLHAMLEEDTGKPVIIFMHHSPFVVEEIPDPHQFHDWQEVDAFGELLSRFGNIESIYCGHVHRNVEGMIGDLPVHVLSCMATDLRKGKLTETEKTRPMYRLIDLGKYAS